MAYSREVEDAKKVRMWLEWLEDEAKSIPQVLYDCFNYVGLGLELRAVHDNGVELVRFASRCARKSSDIPTLDTASKSQFLSMLESMATKLEIIAKERGTHEAESEAIWARRLHRDACEDLTSVRYCNIYDLILKNWNALKNWSGTYKLLIGVVCIQADWEDSEELRDELARIIEDIASEW